MPIWLLKLAVSCMFVAGGLVFSWLSIQGVMDIRIEHDAEMLTGLVFFAGVTALLAVGFLCGAVAIWWADPSWILD